MLTTKLPWPVLLLCLAVFPGVAPVAALDGDADGIPDELELALAQRFFPLLNLHCGTYEGVVLGDRRQLYGHDVPGYSNASNGRLPFVVRPYSPGIGTDCSEPFECLEIRYGVAWSWDLGDDISDWTVFRLGGAHRGDSELYAVLVTRKSGSLWSTPWSQAQNDANAWRLVREFMSAHWSESTDSSSFRGHGRQGVTTHQRVWVSEGKHAMYPGWRECNAGAWQADDCSDNRCDVRADLIADLQNVGRKQAPLNPFIPAPGASPTTSPAGVYDVWGPARFGTATPYATSLDTAPIAWCPVYQYCVYDCNGFGETCSEPDFVIGSCMRDCGWGSEPGGLLCQGAACF
ncbi:MAG: hypothetical protein SF066_15065 [Thermoanaerobaculia bacterium]|nr:hypothetical protein [Thermoanaerobaculia bacterium]